MSNDHILTSTRGPSEGKFAFTSHEAGDHQICLSTDYPSSRGQAPQVRMHLDIIIGDAKPDNSNRDRAHITDLAARVRDLNAKLRDIRKEQQFQRERESEFRNLSEQTNSRAVWWSMVQLVTLVGTCVWQLRHLRVSLLKRSWENSCFWSLWNIDLILFWLFSFPLLLFDPYLFSLQGFFEDKKLRWESARSARILHSRPSLLSTSPSIQNSVVVVESLFTPSFIAGRTHKTLLLPYFVHLMIMTFLVFDPPSFLVERVTFRSLELGSVWWIVSHLSL